MYSKMKIGHKDCQFLSVGMMGLVFLMVGYIGNRSIGENGNLVKKDMVRFNDGSYQEHWPICDDSDCCCTGCTGAITHWMKLPEPPK